MTTGELSRTFNAMQRALTAGRLFGIVVHPYMGRTEPITDIKEIRLQPASITVVASLQPGQLWSTEIYGAEIESVELLT